MYKLSMVNEDIHKYTNTWIGLKSEDGHRLVEAKGFHRVRPGTYSMEYVYFDRRLRTAKMGNQSVRDEDIIWAPRLAPGYYNMPTKSAYWCEMTAARQYKVGLNQTVLLSSRSISGRLGPCAFSTAVHAWEDGHNLITVPEAIKRLNSKATKAQGCWGITKTLGLHSYNKGIIFVGYRMRKVIGLVQDGSLLLETAARKHNLEEHAEVKYVPVERLSTILRDLLRATF